ncbi:MAG: serine/threonine protein kinase [Myxococcaceae bacterium]|nr:MAG: serine/threonine protein kinase [Myxococcaceae bacterium]
MSTNVTEETESEDPLQPGAMFGRYAIVRRIGKGGMGAVYEATHVDLQKRVALKTLHPEFARDATIRARFLQEGKAASRLRHPHVVDVSDFGVQDGNAYLVMEYLEGEGLDALLERDGALEVERIAEILLPICSAVSAAHREGIVHRDLKPENVFLARNALGQTLPKVLDFGISKLDDPASGFARTGSSALLGTPYYMSPEQAQGANRVDARSDQYALGVIAYECATGQRPFDADALFVLLKRVVEGDARPPRALRPDLPIPFERMILRAMSVDPGDRFPSVETFAAELVAFAGSTARTTWEPLLAHATAPSPSGGPGRAAPTSTLNASAAEIPARTPDSLRKGLLWTAVAVAVACALVAAGSALTRRPSVAGPAASAPVTVLRREVIEAPTVAPTPAVVAVVTTPTAPPPATASTVVTSAARSPGARRPARPRGRATSLARPRPDAVERGTNGASIEE